MAALSQYLDDRLAQGRAFFSKKEALKALDMTSSAFIAATGRLLKKRRLASPRRGFYLVLRPEDRGQVPHVLDWIDPLMKHIGLDYRIGLLGAASYHGASHQAPMVFQIIVPKQLRDFDIDGNQVRFVFQAPSMFEKTNRPDWLMPVQGRLGEKAKASGVEVTLLDCARYLRKVAGFDNLAQIIQDMGMKAEPRKLADVASNYENSTVRRLGYLLDFVGHARQAEVLEPFAKEAKSVKLLRPPVSWFDEIHPRPYKDNPKWKLTVNHDIDLDCPVVFNE